jgi:hypothetical protein
LSWEATAADAVGSIWRTVPDTTSRAEATLRTAATAIQRLRGALSR